MSDICSRRAIRYRCTQRIYVNLRQNAAGARKGANSLVRGGKRSKKRSREEPTNSRSSLVILQDT